MFPLWYITLHRYLATLREHKGVVITAYVILVMLGSFLVWMTLRRGKLRVGIRGHGPNWWNLPASPLEPSIHFNWIIFLFLVSRGERCYSVCGKTGWDVDWRIILFPIPSCSYFSAFSLKFNNTCLLYSIPQSHSCHLLVIFVFLSFPIFQLSWILTRTHKKNNFYLNKESLESDDTRG